jgi:type II secretory pathway pseudopilin PulG
MVEKFRPHHFSPTVNRLWTGVFRPVRVFYNAHHNQKSGAAFTLIEMLVVVGIIVVVTTTVLANNSKFGGVILLQNLAYDIALSTREAQIYGISVRRFQSSFNSAFGVHYDLTGNNDKTYTIFSDSVGVENGHYECPQPGTTNCELVQSTSITRGFYIGDLCVTTGGTEDCSPTTLDIVYKHPEPDAYIRIGTSATLYERARVVVMSPRGDSMNICVDLNGQISIHSGASCTY